jgi:hypothetical protein
MRSCVREVRNAQAVVLAIGAALPENGAMLFDLAAQYARARARSISAHFSPAIDHPGGCFTCRLLRPSGRRRRVVRAARRSTRQVAGRKRLRVLGT